MRGCRAGLEKSSGRKPLGRGHLRPRFPFLPVTSRFLVEGQRQLPVVSCRWTAGRRESLVSSAPSASSAVKEPFQMRGRGLSQFW